MKHTYSMKFVCDYFASKQYDKIINIIYNDIYDKTSNKYSYICTINCIINRNNYTINSRRAMLTKKGSK